MPTRHPDTDAPTLKDWAAGVALTTFIVIGCPALAELLAFLVKGGA
ncbi:MAG: hypothetical protein K0S49_47 [Microbacterium sp.]|jgi:hypothetical protein|nr:hypothetical protein [Microbacterium sp.]